MRKLFFGKPKRAAGQRFKAPTVLHSPGLRYKIPEDLTWSGAVERGVFLLRQYLDAARADERFGFYLPSLDLLIPFLEWHPEERERIVQLAAAGRLAPSPVMSELDAWAGCESSARNLAMARRVLGDRLGIPPGPYLGLEDDGFAVQMPQLLRLCGYETAILAPSGGSGGGENRFGWWTGPGGAAVRLVLGGLARDAGVPLEKQSKERAEKLVNAKHPLNASLMMETRPMAPPEPGLAGRCGQWAGAAQPIEAGGGALAKFAGALASVLEPEGEGPEASPEPVSDPAFDCPCHDIAVARRRMEALLYDIECWSAVNAAHGKSARTAAAQSLWSRFLFLQRPENGAAPANEIVHIDTLGAYRELIGEAEALRTDVFGDWTSLMNTAAAEFDRLLAVFNTLPWRRPGVARLAVDVPEGADPFELQSITGEKIPIEIETLHKGGDGKPAKWLITWVERQMPHTSYHAAGLKSRNDIAFPAVTKMQSQYWLDNGRVRLEIGRERGGGIVSLRDKQLDLEWIDRDNPVPANTLLRFGDGGEGLSVPISQAPAEAEYREGPVTQRLIMSGPGPLGCNVIREMRLSADLPYVDCVTVVEDYPGREDGGRDLLAMAFPLNLPGSAAVCGGRFYARAGGRCRPGPALGLENPIGRLEGGLTPAQRWVDVSWTLLIRFVENKEERASMAAGPAEIVAGEKAAGTAARLRRHLERQGIPAFIRAPEAPPAPVEWSFYLDEGGGNACAKPLLDKNPEAGAYCASRLHENGRAVLALRDGGRAPAANVVILAGKTPGELDRAANDAIHSKAAQRWDIPWEACFIPDPGQVTDTGFAVFNQGANLCGMMAGGTLIVTMANIRPAAGSITPWPPGFAGVRNYAFAYRLYPHQGCWRHAEIPRRAMEYPHEPVAVPMEAHAGPMNPKASFFAVEPANVTVSSIKPAGAGDANATVFRVAEAHGMKSNIWIESRDEFRSAAPAALDESPMDVRWEMVRQEKSIRAAIEPSEILTLLIKGRARTERAPAMTPPAEAALLPPSAWFENRPAGPGPGEGVALCLRDRRPGALRPGETVHPLELVVLNLGGKREARGEVKLTVPPYWRIVPETAPFRVAPGGYEVIPATLLPEGGERSGFAAASAVIEGAATGDRLYFGPEPAFDLAMRLTADALSVQLGHNRPHAAEGRVSLISPVETWTAELFPQTALSGIHPYSQPFLLPPGGTDTVSFAMPEYPGRFASPGKDRPNASCHWCVVKIASCGHVWYYHIRLDGKPSHEHGLTAAARRPAPAD